MEDNCLNIDTLKSCPSFVREIASDCGNVGDSVHCFVRLMACYEIVIKCLAVVAHGIRIDTDAPESYQRAFESSFVAKRPALGDWLSLLQLSVKSVGTGGPKWVQPPFRWLRDNGIKDSAISRLGRFVELARQPLPPDGAPGAYKGLDGLQSVLKLRNAFGHGSLTQRFAERYNSILRAALDELLRNLSITANWRFIVPLHYDPNDPARAYTMDPEHPEEQPKSMLIGERSSGLRWHSLYIGGSHGHTGSEESLESVVRLGPMMRYERTLREYQFLNFYENGEIEYLSYRSGDFDSRSADGNWRDFFGISMSPPAESDEADPESPVSEPAGRGTTDDSPVAAATPDQSIGTPAEPPASVAPPAVPESAAEGPMKSDARDAEKRGLVEHFRMLPARALPKWWSQELIKWPVWLNPYSDEELLTFFKDLQDAAGQSDDKLQFLASLQERLGFHELAVELLRDLAQRASSNAQVKSRYGCALLQYGKRLKDDGKMAGDYALIDRGKQVLAQAKEAFTQSLNPQPQTWAEKLHNARALSMLADACCRRGEFDEAECYCDQGLAMRDGDARLASVDTFVRLDSQRTFIREQHRRHRRAG